jgi:DNA repair exonuclease SbcCD nuclease subunit
MKKRFLIVGDNHLDSQTPQSRLDNYMESSLMELSETLKIAKAVKADYYILLGDVFNRIEVGGACRNRAVEILASNDGEPWPFKKYVCVGNHDIAHNPSYIGKSALQTLLSAGVLECVDFIEEADVRFLHFTPDLDERLRKGELMNYFNKIYFCHASIVNKPSRFEHVLFSDLIWRDTTKIICSGHIHSPMEATSECGVKFFNPGSIGRTKIEESHAPQVLLIEYDYDTDKFAYKYFKLKNSLNYDVVFDLDKSKQRKTDNKNTEMFIKSVTNITVGDTVSSDIEVDFRTFAKNKNVKDKDIIEAVVDTINLIKTGGKS